MSGTLILLGLVVLGVLVLAAIGSMTPAKEKPEPRERTEEVLTKLIMQLVLQEDNAGAIAVFCAYRALTMPDKRALAAAMAAEVDRRYGTRVPWPKELRFQVKLLLDDFHADELSRIEADIQKYKQTRVDRSVRDEKQAALATKLSGW
jgi:hypothetical protein